MLLNGLDMDERFAQTSPEGATSYLSDALGNTIGVTDANGSKVGSYSYAPYGGTSFTGSVTTPFEFTGRENDGATNLYYYRARYYSPELGRFIAEDPSGFAGGLDLYAYALGDPIDGVDPTGLGTVAVGGQVSANWIALFNLSLQVSLSWNSAALTDLSQWRIGGVLSIVPGTGVSSGFGASAGGLLTYSQANCPEEFRGWSGTFGGSGGIGVVVGGDVGNVNVGAPKTYNVFGGVGLEISPEFFRLPVEGHAGAGWTAAGSFAF